MQIAQWLLIVATHYVWFWLICRMKKDWFFKGSMVFVWVTMVSLALLTEFCVVSNYPLDEKQQPIPTKTRFYGLCLGDND